MQTIHEFPLFKTTGLQIPSSGRFRRNCRLGRLDRSELLSWRQNGADSETHRASSARPKRKNLVRARLLKKKNIFRKKVRARIDLSPFFTKCFRTFVTDSYEISWGFENQRNETRNFASVFFNPRGEWSNNLQPVKSIALTRAKMHTWAQKPTAINNISM